MRHAKSDWGQPGLDDFDRPLNERGRDSAATMRREMSERNMIFDTVVSSPATRTRETIARLGLEGQARWVEDLYLASTDTLLRLVRALPDDAVSALIVGHNPGLQDIILCLARPDSGGLRRRVLAKFPTAALAVIDLDVETWAEVEPASGTITQLLLPRELG